MTQNKNLLPYPALSDREAVCGIRISNGMGLVTCPVFGVSEYLQGKKLQCAVFLSGKTARPGSNANHLTIGKK